MTASLAALVADIDETLDAAAGDVAAGLPMDADYLLRVLGYVRERIAGPRIAVREHSLPGNVPADLWGRALVAMLPDPAERARALAAWRGESAP